MPFDKQAELAKVEQRAERERQNVERRAKIVEAMPADMPFEPDRIHPDIGYRCDATMKFEGLMNWREDVAALLAKLPPVPVVYFKEPGTSSFFPESRLTEKEVEAQMGDEPRAKSFLIAPFILKINQTPNYAPRCEIEFWTELGGFLVNVECEIKGHPQPLRYRTTNEKRRFGKGAILSADWFPAADFHIDQYIRYSSGDHDRSHGGPITVYWLDFSEDALDDWNRLTEKA